MKKQIMVTCIIMFLLSLFLTVFYCPAYSANKLHFQYVVLPTTVFVDSDITLTICLVNQGSTGELIYDGAGNTDYVTISIPLGNNPSDLLDDPALIECLSQNPDWICDPPVVLTDEVLLTFYPNGTVTNTRGGDYLF